MNNELYDRLAKGVLEKYDGEFLSVDFFTKATSVVYKVVKADARVFALKIYDPGSSNLEDNLIEILILEAIEEKGNISVAGLLKNKNGESITVYKDALSDTTHRMTISKWLEGIDFNKNESEALFVQLGKTVAEMHLILQTISLPERLAPKKWNQVFYFRNEKTVYHDPQYAPKLSSNYQSIMDAAIPILNAQLKRIYRLAPAQLLHGDLNPWNIKIDGKKLTILDFEDAIYGPPIQDIAILLFGYLENEKFPYALVKSCILKGYRSVRELPPLDDRDIEILMMARTTNFLNYVLTLEEDYQEFIEKGLAKLDLFLQKLTSE